MKWERTDLAVGSVVVAALLILLGSFLWLSPALSARTYPLYAEFDRIDGLSSQANVMLRGYTVGQVGDIQPSIDSAGNLRFRVQMNIQWRLASGDTLFLRQGTEARLVPPAVIGSGYIVLEQPDRPGPRLEPGSTLPGVRSTAVLEQVQDLTQNLGNQLMETMTTARTLMDSSIATITQANDVVARTASRLPTLMASLEDQLELAQGLTTDLRDHINTMAPAATATIDSATLLLGDSRRLVHDVNQLLQQSQPQMEGILANMDTTSLLLQNFVRQVSQRPWKAFTGVKPPAGLEPPPPGPPVDSPAAAVGNPPPR